MWTRRGPFGRSSVGRASRTKCPKRSLRASSGVVSWTTMRIDENRPFTHRVDAGRELASRLASYAGRSDVVVLALPRGGVPVGAQVADALGAPLDVFLVRKLGTPGHRELAMGAIATGGVRVINE